MSLGPNKIYVDLQLLYFKLFKGDLINCRHYYENVDEYVLGVRFSYKKKNNCVLGFTNTFTVHINAFQSVKCFIYLHDCLFCISNCMTQKPHNDVCCCCVCYCFCCSCLCQVDSLVGIKPHCMALNVW